jgi:hypothetical protein
VRAAGISRRNAVVFKPDDRAAVAAAKVMKFEFYFNSRRALVPLQ